MSRPANLSATAFAGTAEDYAKHRPPYPADLLDALTRLAPSRRRALDLACGPGRIALDLAERFDDVWAVDLEPEMVAVGRRRAEARGLANLRWFVGRAERLDAPSGAFDLITVGEAFHRLDQPAVLDLALRCLRPGGLFATMGSRGLLAGDEPWQRTVSAISRRWMERAFPQGWGAGAPSGPDHDPQTLRQAGLTDIVTAERDIPHTWSFEAIMGYLRSTSVCSASALGADYARLEAELRAALDVRDDTALTFREDLNFGFTAGRKPHRETSPLR